MAQQTRRRLLNRMAAIPATGGAMAIAGCGEQNDSSTETADQQSQYPEPVYATFGGEDYTSTTANLASATNYDVWVLPRFMNTPFASYDLAADELEFYLFEDATVEGEQLQLTIDDGFSWHNGDPVTAADVATQFKLNSMMGDVTRSIDNPELFYSDISAVTAQDETTVTIDLVNAFNERLLTRFLFGTVRAKPSLWTPAAVYGEYVEAYESATTDTEREGVKQDVLEFDWTYEDAYGSGIAAFETLQENRMVLRKHEEHPDSDNVPWETLLLKSNQQKIPSARNHQIDYMLLQSFPADTDLGSGWDSNSTRLFSNGGPGLIPDHTHEYLGQREVKQALAHVVNREQVAETLGTHVSIPAPARNVFSESQAKQYVGGPIAGSLTQYNSVETAQSLLEGAGFSRDDGQWYTPEDTPFSIDMHTFVNDSWSATARAIEGAFNQFGIQTELQVIPPGRFFSQFGNQSFDLVVEFWSNGGTHPYKGFTRNMKNSIGGGGMGYPSSVEAPPVGDPAGDLETFDIDALLQQVLTGSEQEAVSAIQTLGWVQNQTLPAIAVVNTFGRRFYSTDDWSWPANDDAFWNTSENDSWGARTGALQRK